MATKLGPRWSKNPWAWALFGFSVSLFVFLQMFPADLDSAQSYAAYFPWRCPIKLVTGLSCLGCGMTRSVLLVLSGDIQAAFRMHPLGPIVAAVITFYVVAWVYRPSVIIKLHGSLKII